MTEYSNGYVTQVIELVHAAGAIYIVLPCQLLNLLYTFSCCSCSPSTARAMPHICALDYLQLTVCDFPPAAAARVQQGLPHAGS
jgi:hypothetical protein